MTDIIDLYNYEELKMKTCKTCGKELLDEAVICPQCGCPVEAQPTAAQPVQPNVEGVSTDGDTIVANVQQKLNGKIVLPIISLTVATIGIFFFVWIHMAVGTVIVLLSIFVNIFIETKVQKEIKPLPKHKKKHVIKSLREKCLEYKMNFIATIVASCLCIGCGVSLIALDAYADFESEWSQDIYSRCNGVMTNSGFIDCYEWIENLKRMDQYNFK